MKSTLVFALAIGAAVADPATYDTGSVTSTSACPNLVGTWWHNGNEWVNRALTTEETTALAQSVAAGSSGLYGKAAAAATAKVQDAAACLLDIGCNVNCYLVTATKCAGDYQTTAKQDIRAESDPYDACAVEDGTNYFARPEIPAKTEKETCSTTAGCKTSGTTCIADDRDIQYIEDSQECLKVGTDTSGDAAAKKAACEDVTGSQCEWSSGVQPKPCTTVDGAVMSCNPTKTWLCSKHQASVARQLGDDFCSPPPPPPAPCAGIKLKQSGPNISAQNDQTDAMFRKMKAAFNSGKTVDIKFVSCTPYLESHDGSGVIQTEQSYIDRDYIAMVADELVFNGREEIEFSPKFIEAYNQVNDAVVEVRIGGASMGDDFCPPPPPPASSAGCATQVFSALVAAAMLVIYVA